MVVGRCGGCVKEPGRLRSHLRCWLRRLPLMWGKRGEGRKFLTTEGDGWDRLASGVEDWSMQKAILAGEREFIHLAR